MKNNYEIRGDITAIFVKYKNQILETMISTAKLPRAQEFPNTWYAYWAEDSKSLYIQGNFSGGKRHAVVLQRWIMEVPSHITVDHVNHNGLDNTDDNLKMVPKYKNQQNRRGIQSNNISGYRNVSWDKSRKRWRVAMQSEGEWRQIGRYVCLRKAVKISEDSRRKYMPYLEEINNV